MPDITSRQHPIVKAFRSAARGDGAAALLDGWHLLGEAERALLEVETVAVAGDPPDAAAARLLDEVSRTARVLTVSAEVMNAISPVRTPSGVTSLVRKREWSLDEVLSPAPALVIVAIDLQDPGNAGAVVRAAEAGGGSGVVFCGASADPWGWKALRAAMGSTFRLPVAREPDASSACARLRSAGLSLLATVPRGGEAMHEADFTMATALIIGGEGDGVPAALLDTADRSVSIPMAGEVESLNVAVAAAVLVYEARRQRHK